MPKGLLMSEMDTPSFGNSGLAANAATEPTAVSAQAADPGLSAGAILRQAREQAGLHIAALAVALKVPVKKIEALEADELDQLPDAVFVRALAASVCRTLKIDAAPVLARLPQTAKPRLDYPNAGINTPFRAHGDAPGRSPWSQLSRPAVLTGLLLLLGALVLIFLPAVQQQSATVLTGAPVAGADSGSAAFAPDESGIAMATTDVLDSKPLNPVVPPEPVQPAVPPISLSASLSLSDSQPPAAAVESAVAAEKTRSNPTGLIVFRALGESWVEVTDGKGVVVLSRLLANGDAVGVSGALPLVAVVGRVDVTQVQVRGRDFDLNAFSKNNVARFEVK